MDDIIVAENLSKSYRLYSSPKGRLLEALSFGRCKRHTDMPALNNVSFRVAKGECIGFIGPNGAGKSTLLRLLCGASHPTSGSLQMHGRVAALLELGTGFNMEFTGRQNAFFNAMLMGLTRQDIHDRMEEIKAFSELGDFFERPVKTYSSGMIVRLGFSVATCVDPDILIVDEALAVGDEHFQKKSLDRVLSFRNAGKTIVFVSHSMYHIRHLCQRACWLHRGEVRRIGEAEDVIQGYNLFNKQEEGVVADAVPLTPAPAEAVTNRPYVTKCALQDLDGNAITEVAYDKPFQMLLGFDSGGLEKGIHLGFYIDQCIEGVGSDPTIAIHTTLSEGLQPILKRRGVAVVTFSALRFRPGTYRMIAGIVDDTGCIIYERVHLSFTITSDRTIFSLVSVPHTWEIGD